MPQRQPSRRAKAAMYASLLARFRQPHDLEQLLLLILIWAHVRSRPGYSLTDAPLPISPCKGQRPTPKQRGIYIKRPRSRFL